MELEYTAEWFEFANTDLATAEFLLAMRPQPLEIICYHCQQSAEKSLKAFLINNNIEPSKTHDLKLLCRMCQDSDNTFAEITNQCAHLTPYGVTARYPDELIPDENMVKLAIIKAKEVYDFCVSKIKTENSI